MILPFMSIGMRKWFQDRIGDFMRPTTRFNVADYWETRYAAGGTSGEGSYGRLAEFKARVINDFVVEHEIRSVIEFGCGDGNQLSLLRVPQYVGLDISKSAVRRCIERFHTDETKSFFLFDSGCFLDSARMFAADLVLSLDVIFHLVDDDGFEAYMTQLCESCRLHLVLYTTDYDRMLGAHERHRQVSTWMQKRPEFALARSIPNPYAGSRDGHEESDAGFLMYQRVVPWAY